MVETILVLSSITGEVTPIKGQTDVEIRMESVCISHRVLVTDMADDVVIGIELLETNKISLDI